MDPTLWFKVPSLWLYQIVSTGKSPTCLFRGGGSLGVDSSSLGQREVPGGREAEHKTGLPVPESRRQSWEEKGSPEKQPQETGKKRPVRKACGVGRGAARTRRRHRVEEQRWCWLGSCKAGWLGNWIPGSTSMWMDKSALGQRVNPTGLAFGLNTGLWAISASLHQARVASTVLLETETFLPTPGQRCPGQMNRARCSERTVETV